MTLFVFRGELKLSKNWAGNLPGNLCQFARVGKMKVVVLNAT